MSRLFVARPGHVRRFAGDSAARPGPSWAAHQFRQAQDDHNPLLQLAQLSGGSEAPCLASWSRHRPSYSASTDEDKERDMAGKKREKSLPQTEKTAAKPKRPKKTSRGK